ncbi:MAG: hypothetical protein H8E42_11255 [Nitrospinae bacterium]|nr:hypothetical protein [Nitrospinota bacterium]MBL7019785.1 hypothetical protein [Nitrospinaceae bacterium]
MQETNGPLIFSRLNDQGFSEHARWIGIIIGNGALLESELELLYSQVFKLEYHRSKILFYSMQHTLSERKAISAGIKEFFPDTEILSAWNAIQNSLEMAINKRNLVAHAVWAEDPKTKELQFRKTHVGKRYKNERELYSVDKLEKIATEIAEVSGKLNQISTMLVKTKPPPPIS